ncbi:zinc finger matrin-type protein 2-like isoform X1 [Salvia splendens]|uniref:zinc finger matrin-type protein 2-like isoform X1 n=1 Tax=Salvia splendens TaxID=180675 RepID=UPI001C25E6A8|nr:zinc finger matrin-type protein 2-like isoform X1 [Salvia splendens]
MAQSGSGAAGIVNTYPKKFDREEYLQRARDREAKEEARNKSKSSGPPVQRKPLKHRDYEVYLESRLGKTQAGYYCSVCECVVKDSANYLDHINGKKHRSSNGLRFLKRGQILQALQSKTLMNGS